MVLRKSYGLGALAMTGGSYPASVFAVAWPTGEFGGMGLEGSVKLGYRNELAAIADPAARKAKFDEMVARAYEHGKALNHATTYRIDDVIDPADTRRWIMGALQSSAAARAADGEEAALDRRLVGRASGAPPASRTNSLCSPAPQANTCAGTRRRGGRGLDHGGCHSSRGGKPGETCNSGPAYASAAVLVVVGIISTTLAQERRSAGCRCRTC